MRHQAALPSTVHRESGTSLFPMTKGLATVPPVHPMGQRPVVRDSMGCPSLSVHPLGTEGWDGQLGQRPVVRDSMGCPSLSSVYPLGTEGWDRQLGQRQRGPHGIVMDILPVP